MAYTGPSIVDYLKSVGQSASFSDRKKMAAAQGITNYTGTAAQNTQLLNTMRAASSATKPATQTSTPTNTATTAATNLVNQTQTRLASTPTAVPSTVTKAANTAVANTQAALAKATPVTTSTPTRATSSTSTPPRTTSSNFSQTAFTGNSGSYPSYSSQRSPTPTSAQTASSTTTPTTSTSSVPKTTVPKVSVPKTGNAEADAILQKMASNSSAWSSASTSEQQRLANQNLAYGNQLKAMGINASRDANGVWNVLSYEQPKAAATAAATSTTPGQVSPEMRKALTSANAMTLREAAAKAGYEVGWDQQTQQVTLTSPDGQTVGFNANEGEDFGIDDAVEGNHIVGDYDSFADKLQAAFQTPEEQVVDPQELLNELYSQLTSQFNMQIDELNRRNQGAMDALMNSIQSSTQQGTAPLSQPQNIVDAVSNVLQDMYDMSATDEVEEAKKVLDSFLDATGIDKTQVVVPDVLTFDQAKDQAAQMLDPLYAEQQQRLQQQLQEAAVRSGFAGQLPWTAYEMENQGQLERQRTSDIANTAQSLVGQSRDAANTALSQAAQKRSELFNMLNTAMQTTQGNRDSKLSSLTQWLNAVNSNKSAQLDQEKAKLDIAAFRQYELPMLAIKLRNAGTQADLDDVNLALQQVELATADEQKQLELATLRQKIISESDQNARENALHDWELAASAIDVEKGAAELDAYRQYELPMLEQKLRAATTDAEIAEVDLALRNAELSVADETQRLKLQALRQDITNASSANARANALHQWQVAAAEYGIEMDKVQLADAVTTLADKDFNAAKKEVLDMAQQGYRDPNTGAFVYTVELEQIRNAILQNTRLSDKEKAALLNLIPKRTN